MPAPKKGYSLGSDPSHQRLMLRNLARSLFEHERVRTTEAKAKLLRPYAEKLITKAKEASVHHQRLVRSEIADREVVHKLFAEIGPRFAARNGGYTRILKLGQRNGDGAPMALIELVEHAEAPPTTEAEAEAEAEPRRRFGRGRRRGVPQDKRVLSKGEQAHAVGQAQLGGTEAEEAESDEAAQQAAAEAEANAAVDAEAGEQFDSSGGIPPRRETRSGQESKQD